MSLNSLKRKLSKKMGFEDFSITIPGKYHREHLLNCQDHAFTDAFQNTIIGIVSDGVGSLEYAEFASLLMASGTLKYLKRLKNYDNIARDVFEYIEEMKKYCLSFLREKERRNAYCATLLFFIITPEYFWIYTQGDGFYGVNKKIYEVKGNAQRIDDCTLELSYKGKTQDLDNIWVSTDGLRFSENIKQYLTNGESKEHMFDLIKLEHEKDILNDDFGLALSYRL